MVAAPSPMIDAHRLLVAEAGTGIEGVGDVQVAASRPASRSSSGSTEAMPPCAQAVLESRASPLVITVTEPWAAARIAKDRPATPEPMTRKSEVTGEVSAKSARREGETARMGRAHGGFLQTFNLSELRG